MRLERFKVLSDGELTDIHEASLKTLSETGVMIYSEKVLKLLEDAGAQVDLSQRRVRIPAALVGKCLKTLPAKIVLYDRDKNLSLTLSDNKNYTASGHNAIYVLDLETGERRKSTKKDVADFARISDALENIHMVGIQAMPQDVNPRASLLHAVDAVFNSTTKPIFFSPEALEVSRGILSIARAVISEEDLSKHPILICQLSPTSPLTWETGAVESVVEIAESGVPLCFLPQPYSGVTAPLTLAGTLTVHNAEVLSGIVISQVVREGSPVIYGSAWTTFDMREANVVIGGPETVLMRIAGVQLAKFYNIPVHTIGPDTDSHCLDEQNAWEKMATTLAPLCAGVDLIVNAGMFETGLTVSYEQLVLDNEMLGWLFRFIDGIKVSSDTVAIDLINKVGPKGNFLTEEHTLKYLRSGEHWQPSVSNRDLYEKWKEKGSKSVVENAKIRSKKILQTHQVRKLDSKVRKRIDKIIELFEET